MITGVVFDLGETLIHFSGDWQRVFARSRSALVRKLVEHGYHLPEAAFSEAVGRRIEAAQQAREDDDVERPARELVRATLAEFGHNRVDDEHLDAALRGMFAVSEDQWIPSAQAVEVLRTIDGAGYRLGMISNASDGANVRRLVDKVGVQSLLDPILVSAEVGVRKPSRVIFQALLSAWDVAPQQVVMIGDTLEADIVGAQQAGMHQIWLRSAASRADNVAAGDRVQPEWSVDALADVVDILPRISEPA
jgi:putative hydrolase of the HAD superfamily